jgi:hypothetical protein
MQPTKQWSMQMRHDPFMDYPKSVRLERVAHLLMCEVDEAIEAALGGTTWPIMSLKQIKMRVEELQILVEQL